MPDGNVKNSVHVEIPPAASCLPPVLDLIESYANQLGIQSDRCRYLKSACQSALSTVIAHIQAGAIERKGGHRRIRVAGESFCRGAQSRCSHLYGAGWESKQFHDASRHLDKMSIQNRGRSGQTVSMGMRLGEVAAKRSMDALRRRGKRMLRGADYDSGASIRRGGGAEPALLRGLRL